MGLVRPYTRTNKDTDGNQSKKVAEPFNALIGLIRSSMLDSLCDEFLTETIKENI